MQVCVASRCADDGTLWLVFQDVDGGDTKEYQCPSGEFVDLGSAQGFEDDVCSCLCLYQPDQNS